MIHFLQMNNERKNTLKLLNEKFNVFDAHGFIDIKISKNLQWNLLMAALILYF